jgi:hypothetical protein
MSAKGIVHLPPRRYLLGHASPQLNRFGEMTSMVTDDPSRGPEAPWQTPDPTADPKARSRRTGLGAPAIPQDTTPHLRAVHVALGMTPGAGVTPTPLPMMVEAGMTLEEAKGRLSMAETGTAPPAPTSATVGAKCA